MTDTQRTEFKELIESSATVRKEANRTLELMAAHII